MYERLIKRTIWVAECVKCDEKDVRDHGAPRERQCPKCKEWIPFVEQSAIGPDLSA